MRKVVVINNVTLDGVMQAPARPDEDSRGGFSHGGWARGYDEAGKAAAMGPSMARAGALLLGRRTYEDFYRVWPHRTESPFSGYLTNVRKYVASRTLAEPLPWENSILLAGDAADAVARLRQQDATGGEASNLVVLGSGELTRSLARRGLVDEYVLLIHPLVLGSGQRLFNDQVPPTRLRLAGSGPAGDAGVIIATYLPEAGAETGKDAGQ
jgi:dihydrofolate reductase